MRLKERLIEAKNGLLAKLHINVTESDATEYSDALKDYLFKEFTTLGRIVTKTDNGLLVKLKHEHDGYSAHRWRCRARRCCCRSRRYDEEKTVRCT